jgi:hypothetical protein
MRNSTMASALSGPFSVRAGSVIGGAVSGGRAIPSQPRRLSDTERRHMAVRLRRDGWSYQRIAQTLEMRYSLVAAIADGPDDTPAAPATTTIPSERRVPVQRRAAPVEEDGDMARKLDDLIAAVARQSETIARLEAELPRAIEAAHATLFDRLVQSFKGMFDRLLPHAAASGSPPADPPSEQA